MFIKPQPCQKCHIGKRCFSQLKTFMVQFSLLYFSETVKLDCVTVTRASCEQHWLLCRAVVGPFLAEASTVSVLSIFTGDLLSFTKEGRVKLLLHGRPATCCKHLYVAYGWHSGKGQVGGLG